MPYVTGLLYVLSFVLILTGKDVSIIHYSTTWNEASKHCGDQDSRLADISDVITDHLCSEIFHSTGTNTYWVGNFYKLSGKILFEGCYNITEPKIEEGYKFLHDCFELCSKQMNKNGMFAHKAVFGRGNCICDQQKNVQVVDISKCSNRLLPFWSVYKVDLSDIHIGHETCQRLTCTNPITNNALRNNLCGIMTNLDHLDLRSNVPTDKLPYVCKANSTSSDTTGFEDYFRFAVYTSVKSDPVEKSSIALNCKVISCVNSDNFNTSLRNCSLTTFGSICVKDGNNSHEFINENSTTNTSSPTTSTIFNFINASLKVSQKYESASYGTTASKITTNSTSIQQTSDVPSHSSLGKVVNPQVVITSPVSSSTEGNSKTTKLHSSKKYSSSHTSSYETDIDKMNIAESKMGSSETLPDSHSRIGLIVGSAVGSVVIIVAVVFLVSCKLRRRGPFREKRFVDDIQINELNDSNYHDDNSKTTPCNAHNTMYDVHTPSGDNTKFGLVDVVHDNSNNIRNNEFAVVVKNNQSGNQVVEKKCDTNGRNFNDLLESEDDRVNHVRPHSGNNSSNIRNHEYAVVVENNKSSNQVVEQNCSANEENSDDVLESEYDRLNHVRPRSGNNSSNIYDSVLGFRDVHDATYTTTVCRGIGNGDDSVYDHT